VYELKWVLVVANEWGYIQCSMASRDVSRDWILETSHRPEGKMAAARGGVVARNTNTDYNNREENDTIICNNNNLHNHNINLIPIIKFSYRPYFDSFYNNNNNSCSRSNGKSSSKAFWRSRLTD